MPPREPLLSRPLGYLTRWVLSAPRSVLAGAVLLALLASLLAQRSLTFHTSRLDLLSPEAAYNQRWLAYLDEFGKRDDAVVVVEGPAQEPVVAALEELARRIRREERLFTSVLYRPDMARLRAKALHYLPIEHLRTLDEFLQHVHPVLEGDWAQLNILRQLQWAQSLASAAGVRRVDWQSPVPKSPETSSAGNAVPADPTFVASAVPPSQLATAEAAGWFAGLTAVLSGQPMSQSPWSKWAGGLEQLAEPLESKFLLHEDGRLGFLLLRIGAEEKGQVQDRGTIDHLREILDQVQSQHTGVRIGLTGMPVLETDEMRASQEDSFRTTLVGFLGVAVVIVAGFGGWRGPLLAVLALALAIAWTFGYITLAVGHLNLLSVSFGVMLIGLGIDFGVHYVARFGQFRAAGVATNPAIRNTARSVGPGIVSGALTTAVAFFSAALTHFKGVAELGVVAGGGIVLCMLAALIVLPAMLHVTQRRNTRESVVNSLPIARLCDPIWRRPVAVLLIAGVVTGILASGLSRLRYDHNLLNLQPLHLESVELERKLAETANRSVWYGLSIADTPAQLAHRKARFESLGVVAHTEEITSLLPARNEEKERLIARVRSRLDRLPDRPPLIPVTPPAELVTVLQRVPVETVAGPIAQQLARLPDGEYYRRLSRFQQGMAEELLRLLRRIRELAEPSPPVREDVPPELLDRYVGRTGKHLLKVYGRGSIWDMDNLERFVKGVESVDPRITGHPVQTYYASRELQTSYIHAAIYSLLVIAIVLVLDFRSVRYTLLSMFPLLMGVLQLFGLLGLLDIPLNAANLIVLPLILGIGIDNGVHIVHEFLEQRGVYRMSNSTACAILLCAVTTTIGFGSMVLSRHQGLRSLGQVLTLGVFSCLVSSLLVLPPLLVYLRPASQPNEELLK